MKRMSDSKEGRELIKTKIWELEEEEGILEDRLNTLRGRIEHLRNCLAEGSRCLPSPLPGQVIRPGVPPRS